RFREIMPDADAGAAGRRRRASAGGFDRRRLALPECRDHGVPLEGAAGPEGAHHQPRARLPEAASDGVAAPCTRRRSNRIIGRLPLLVPLGHPGVPRECPLVGECRKWTTQSQNDEIDPPGRYQVTVSNRTTATVVRS